MLVLSMCHMIQCAALRFSNLPSLGAVEKGAWRKFEAEGCYLLRRAREIMQLAESKPAHAKG